MAVSEKIIESIKSMPINFDDPNRLELPSTPMGNYAQVKAVLQKAGAKYKKNGFNFTSPAKAIVDRICNGESVNDKKNFQFYPTPLMLAMKLIALAGIRAGMKVLEPSAGQGAILNLLHKAGGECTAVEMMPENVAVLGNLPYQFALVEGDFLEQHPTPTFDRVVGNPPFTKNQDIAHVQHMFKFLKRGGVLVSVLSTSWLQGSQKKQIEFRKWLDTQQVEIYSVSAGEFKESGTQIATVVLKITRN